MRLIRKLLKAIVPASVIKVVSPLRMTKNARYYTRLSNDQQLLELAEQASALLRQGRDLEATLEIGEQDYTRYFELSFLLFIQGEIQQALALRLKGLEVFFVYAEAAHSRLEKGVLLAAQREFFALGNAEVANRIATWIDDKLPQSALTDAYSRQLQGKRVLVLGPLYLETEDLQATIDQSDVCILTNAFSLPTELDFSSVQKVVYYNAYNEKRMHLDPALQVLLRDCYSIFRSAKFAYQQKIISSGTGQLLREKPDLLCGAVQAVPLIVHDLACRGCASVKVVGATFYLSKNPYPSSYSTPTHNLLFDIGRHDLASNFLLAKYYYDQGVFRCDAMGKRVIEMSVEQYFKEIESLYKAN